MSSVLRLSPIHSSLQSLKGTWHDINGMPSLIELPSNQSRLGIADLSCLNRFGVKGANAAQWLTSQALSIPERPNSWLPLPEDGIIARLGLTEFLIEGSITSHLATLSPPERVYPVLRQDLALALVGDRVSELLSETCSFNFQAISPSDRSIVLTSMIGVAVTVLPSEHNGQPFYRIWCDGTFGIYFWRTLIEIATELGGGAIGAGSFL